MELMRCQLCGGGAHLQTEIAYPFDSLIYCDSCPIAVACCDPPPGKLEEAWNDLQSKLARLAYLEAMLQSQDTAAGKKAGGRL